MKSEIVLCIERLPFKDIVCQVFTLQEKWVRAHVCGGLKEKTQGNYCMVWHMTVTGEHTQDCS